MENTQELTPKEKQEVQGSEQVRPGRYYVPEVDIAEDADGLWLWVDMPGVDPQRVSVELEDGVLTIQGEVDLQPYEGLTPLYSEYRVGNFVRRFNLPRSYDYDSDRIEAKLNDGVLAIRIPKAEKAKPRRIEVKAA
jgi:HSP20 family molecular chaperone IbpA